MTEGRVAVKRGGPERPWVGQLVPVEVDVVRPVATAPLPAPHLAELAMPGAITLWSGASPPPEEREEGGTRVLVQHRTLLVFPQRDGELTVPRIVARWTDDGGEHALASAPFTFEAFEPPGSLDPPPLVATRVSLEEAFDGPVEGLRVGDSFRRTVTLTAVDSDAVVFPELRLAAPRGLAVYTGEGATTAAHERGTFTGARTETTTYVVERVGPFTLPPLSVRWLEPRSGTFHEATLGPHHLWAHPNPKLGLQAFGASPVASAAVLLGLVLLLVGIVILAVRLARRARRGPSQAALERRAFRALRREARAQKALSTLQALYTWLRAARPSAPTVTLEAFRAETRSFAAASRVSEATRALEQALFGNATRPWQSAPLLAALRRVRRRFVRQRRGPEGLASRPEAPFITDLNETHRLDVGGMDRRHT